MCAFTCVIRTCGPFHRTRIGEWFPSKALAFITHFLALTNGHYGCTKGNPKSYGFGCLSTDRGPMCALAVSPLACFLYLQLVNFFPLTRDGNRDNQTGLVALTLRLTRTPYVEDWPLDPTILSGAKGACGGVFAREP